MLYRGSRSGIYVIDNSLPGFFCKKDEVSPRIYKQLSTDTSSFGENYTFVGLFKYIENAQKIGKKGFFKDPQRIPIINRYTIWEEEVQTKFTVEGLPVGVKIK